MRPRASDRPLPVCQPGGGGGVGRRRINGLESTPPLATRFFPTPPASLSLSGLSMLGCAPLFFFDSPRGIFMVFILLNRPGSAPWHSSSGSAGRGRARAESWCGFKKAGEEGKIYPVGARRCSPRVRGDRPRKNLFRRALDQGTSGGRGGEGRGAAGEHYCSGCGPLAGCCCCHLFSLLGWALRKCASLSQARWCCALRRRRPWSHPAPSPRLGARREREKSATRGGGGEARFRCRESLPPLRGWMQASRWPRLPSVDRPRALAEQFSTLQRSRVQLQATAPMLKKI